jgi:hypothetical protein
VILTAVADPEQVARWERAEETLRASLVEMRSVLDAKAAAHVAEFLDHNELGLAMDTLVDAALESAARDLPAEAVDKLRAASAEMHGYLPDGWDELISRFG